VADGNFRHFVRVKIWHDLNDQPRVIFGVTNPNVAASNICQLYLCESLHEYADAIGVSEQTSIVGSAGLDVFLMRDPMGATSSRDWLPIVIAAVPDKTLLRKDVGTHISHGGEYSGFALGTVFNSIVFPDPFSAWMKLTSWH
jgi:hypothetical protein